MRYSTHTATRAARRIADPTPWRRALGTMLRRGLGCAAADPWATPMATVRWRFSPDRFNRWQLLSGDWNRPDAPLAACRLSPFDEPLAITLECFLGDRCQVRLHYVHDAEPALPRAFPLADTPGATVILGHNSTRVLAIRCPSASRLLAGGGPRLSTADKRAWFPAIDTAPTSAFLRQVAVVADVVAAIPPRVRRRAIKHLLRLDGR